MWIKRKKFFLAFIFCSSLEEKRTLQSSSSNISSIKIMRQYVCKLTCVSFFYFIQYCWHVLWLNRDVAWNFLWRQLDFLFFVTENKLKLSRKYGQTLNKALLNYSKATQSKFNSIQDQLLLINCKILIHPSNTHTIPYKKALQNQKKKISQI